MAAVYLAGKMRGLPDFNYPLFHDYATTWRAAGHTVISPAEQFGGDQTLPFPTYIKHDLNLILSDEIEGVAVIPGWESSEGATAEVFVARTIGKPIYDARFPVALLPYEESITEEAQRLVGGDRNVQYGDAFDDFSAIGKVWSGILGIDVGPAKVGLCMAGLKLVRESFRPKRDNLVDLHGYGLCVARVRAREQELTSG